ncbi:hypothetical protein EEL31_17720 [Brevibacillus laterosporus]|nr:hypothetical protein [Brevibacillus laterosporus]TPG70141.1 hypothetical protein EEL31_17720 [Brevibacillus laterosporus]
MNERKIFELLNNIDDDLVEKEIDKLLEGVEIDMDAINKKAHQKLTNNNKKGKRRKRYSYVAAAACVCLLGVTTAYASDISETIKSFFNKTPIYSTIVDGDAYYLKERYALNNEIAIENIMVSKGNLEMEITTDLSLSELGEINIIPQNDASTVYYPGGYSEEGEKYHFSFTNKTENNYNIKPFKDFKLVIGRDSYNVSLEKAKSLDLNSKIYTSNAGESNIKGVNIGAKVIDENGKSNIQFITSFEDKNLKLAGLGKPIEAKVVSTVENQGKDGMILFSTSNQAEELYVFDEMDTKYKLEIPENSKGHPVTTFETSAPQDKNLRLKLPALVASFDKTIASIPLSIPKEGEATLNKEIDFTIQKAVVKNVKRVSPTSAQIEFELNTDGNKNIDIRSFDLNSPDIKKMSAEFNGNKAIMTLEFDKKLNTTNIQISYPQFVMNGNWAIDIK